MKITIIGTGYVGLVSGAVFADWGHDVVCLDVNQDKIDKIKEGIMPIYEEGLEELVKRIQKEGRFVATTDYELAMKHGELIFICVGTPSNQSGAADLTYVFDVAKNIGELLPEDQYRVIVTKSTVPVGTNHKVKETILKNSEGRTLDFDICSNPEFLREGTSIFDANNTDRVVIGTETDKAFEKMKELYNHLETTILQTSIQSAELIKYASNAFLATKISFINEISQICERVGADVKEVAQGMGLDNRIGGKFLNAGIGYGGSCFPKDVEALYRTSSEKMYDFRLLRGVIDANERQKHYFMEKVWNKYGSNLDGYVFGVLGSAFKNGTDDTRKSVALEVIKMLRGAGAKIKLADPAALENSKRDLGTIGMEYCEVLDDVFHKADGIFILTEWPEFANINYEEMGDKLKSKVIFDGKNLLNPKVLSDLGYEYHSIGRSSYL